jgi:hypothetical protein
MKKSTKIIGRGTDQEAPLALTPQQRSLRKDIEDIASIVKMDHWNILNYRPSRRRTIILKQTKDKLIRGHVTGLLHGIPVSEPS